MHQLHLIVKKHLSFCFSFVAVIQFVLEGLTDWWNVHLMPKPKSIKSFMLRSKLLSFLVQYLGSKYFALRKTFVSAPASLTHWSQNPFLGSKIQFLSWHWIFFVKITFQLIFNFSAVCLLFFSWISAICLLFSAIFWLVCLHFQLNFSCLFTFFSYLLLICDPFLHIFSWISVVCFYLSAVCLPFIIHISCVFTF